MLLNDKQKTALIFTVFAGFVCLLVVAYFYFMFGRATIKSYELKALSARKELTECKAELTRINELLNQEEELDRQAETIRKVTRRLPSSPDAPGFLTAMLTILGTTGIIQEEVKPDKTYDRSLYTEIPYQIKAHGHFHAFGQFLTLIEQNPDRFMRVKRLKISNNKGRPSVHPIEMEIATFMFNEQ